MAYRFSAVEFVQVALTPSELYSQENILADVIKKKVTAQYVGEVNDQRIFRAKLLELVSKLEELDVTSTRREIKTYYCAPVCCRFEYIIFIPGEALFAQEVTREETKDSAAIALVSAKYENQKIVLNQKTSVRAPFTCNLFITHVAYVRETFSVNAEELLYNDVIHNATHCTLAVRNTFDLSRTSLPSYSVAACRRDDFSYGKLYDHDASATASAVAGFFVNPFSLMLYQETEIGRQLLAAFRSGGGTVATPLTQLQLEAMEMDAFCPRVSPADKGVVLPVADTRQIGMTVSAIREWITPIMDPATFRGRRLSSLIDMSNTNVDSAGLSGSETPPGMILKRFDKFDGDAGVAIGKLVESYERVTLVRPLTAEPTSTVFYAVAREPRPAKKLATEELDWMLHGIGFFYTCHVEAPALMHRKELAAFPVLIEKALGVASVDSASFLSVWTAKQHATRTILHEYITLQQNLAECFAHGIRDVAEQAARYSATRKR
jgi:hypothetical protein